MKQFFKNNSIIVLFLVSALAVLFLAVYVNSLMRDAMTMLAYNTEERLLAVARSATDLVSVEELEEFQVPEDMEQPLYSEIKARLSAFSAESNVMYTYYMRDLGTGQYQFIVDNDYDPAWMVGLESDPVDAEPAPLSAMGGVAAVSDVGDYSDNWDGILAAYAPVYDANGEVAAIVGVDISDEQIVQTQKNVKTLSYVLLGAMATVMASGFLGFFLYKRKARLSQAANLAKGQFLSRMSHEIRTPLNAIIGLCRMAQNSDDPAKKQEHLQNISISSTHLLHLVNDILDLSKIEEGKLELDVVPSVTQEELDKIAVIMAPQVAAKNQNFTMRVAPGVPEYVYCDNHHLRQIIVNLLSNAVKFTPENGQITLDLCLLDERGDDIECEFKIRDSGIGIAPEQIEKLFDPFEQGDGSTTRKYGGSGLGLAIAKQLVELMNGHIHVQSTPGKGSVFTFTVWIKRAKDAQKELERETEKTEMPDLSGKRILLVEDSQINQMIAEDMFVSLGAEIDTAQNGSEGTQQYLRNPSAYDLILMDIQMPVMDGYEATKVIRTSDAPNAQTIPIIAMTANVFKEDIDKAKACGMDGHLGKPFDTNAVAATLHALFADKRKPVSD
ncbi:response regulator [Ruminococcaceae bacterium OttesenSCG-928-I18]|nr:response regulator [Ruminococcaceae bacterium OttesenSCG-928-I18]